MKLFFQIAFLLLSGFSFAQSGINLSQGETTEKNYLTTISYEEVKEKIIIEGEINGQTYKFMLDTGAPMIIFKKLSDDLKLSKVNDMVIKDQSNKKDTMAAVILPKIKIGGVTFNNIPTLLSDSPVIECFGIDGIIGSNVLRNSAVQFSSKEKTITITDSPKLLKLKGRSSKSLLDGQSNPFIWIAQKNGKTNASEQLLFDTGMDGFYDLSMPIYKKHFEKLPLFNVIAKSSGTYSAGIHGNADATENYKLVLPELSINNVDFKNVSAKTTYDGNSRIGASLLKYGVVTVDYKNKKFYFEAFQGQKIFDLAEKEWPFNAILDGVKMKVGIVWNNDASQNIKTGDQILKFNEMDFEKMTVCEMILSSFKDLKKEKATMVLKDVETKELKQVEVEKR